jgi:hypothetical protein
VKEVGGGEVGRRENFGAKKSLGKGRGCVFGSSPKQFERLHLELVHWWLLVHTSRRSYTFDTKNKGKMCDKIETQDEQHWLLCSKELLQSIQPEFENLQAKF